MQAERNGLTARKCEDVTDDSEARKMRGAAALGSFSRARGQHTQPPIALCGTFPAGPPRGLPGNHSAVRQLGNDVQHAAPQQFSCRMHAKLTGRAKNACLTLRPRIVSGVFWKLRLFQGLTRAIIGETIPPLSHAWRIFQAMRCSKSRWPYLPCRHGSRMAAQNESLQVISNKLLHSYSNCRG